MPVKGGQRRDIPLPSTVMQFLWAYVEQVLARQLERVGADTPLFWSTWGRRRLGRTRAPMTGKNIWRLCKVYGRRIGCPTLKPHDLRHGVAMEVLARRNRRHAVGPRRDRRVPRRGGRCAPGLRTSREFLKRGARTVNEITMVAPTGFEPVFQP